MLFMWLSASVLIILGLFCSSSNGLLSESQVEKLLKNLNNDEYKNSLPNILYHCTIGSKLYNEVDCLSAKYIFRISLQTDPISNPSITKERSLKVDNTGQEITYSLQLEDYILKSRYVLNIYFSFQYLIYNFADLLNQNVNHVKIFHTRILCRKCHLLISLGCTISSR